MLKMQSTRIVRRNESPSSLPAVSRKFSIEPLQRDEIVKKQNPNFNIHTKISAASEGAKKRRLLNTPPEQRVLDYQHSTRSTAKKPFAKTIKVKKHVPNSGAINEKRKNVTTDPMSIIPKITKSVGSTAKKMELSFVRKLVTDPKMAVATNGYENKIKKIAKSQNKKDKQRTKQVEPTKANQGISSNFQTSVPVSKNLSSQRKLGIKRKLNQFILKDFYGNQRLLVEGQILGLATEFIDNNLLCWFFTINQDGDFTSLSNETVKWLSRNFDILNNLVIIMHQEASGYMGQVTSLIKILGKTNPGGQLRTDIVNIRQLSPLIQPATIVYPNFRKNPQTGISGIKKQPETPILPFPIVNQESKQMLVTGYTITTQKVFDSMLECVIDKDVQMATRNTTPMFTIQPNENNNIISFSMDKDNILPTQSPAALIISSKDNSLPTLNETVISSNVKTEKIKRNLNHARRRTDNLYSNKNCV